ncbi:MAG: hypothetical protein DMD61_03735 [Gemmatimonadetes bacterium]|nr:MAG: hypothetical protein DMD61_03735 [Gemmatimonadota bacterium]
MLRLLRVGGRAAGGGRAVRRGRPLAPRQGLPRDARADEPLRQRRVRSPRQGLRDAADPDDAPQPLLLRGAARPLRVCQGEGPARVRERGRADAGAHLPRREGDRGAEGHHPPAAQHEAVPTRSGTGQGPLQSGVGAQLGIRPPHRGGDRSPGQAAQADRRPGPGVLRRAWRERHRVRRRPARPECGAQAQSVRSLVRHPENPVVRAQNPPLPHPAARHPEGVPHERHRRSDVPLDLDEGRRARLHVGGGRLDPRGQHRHGQRRPPARLPSLQDVPDLRQVPVKAFVTGGTGFVGAHLVQALRARGDEVTCLVRNAAKAQARGWSHVRVIRGDLDDAAALAQGCENAEVIYHVAGRISARDLDEFMRANRDGTANVLEAAGSAWPGRFVLVSSLAAGGPTTPGQPIDESRPPSPVTPYGQSKLAAEVLVKAMARAWTIVRPPAVYGEWDREFLKVFRLARLGFATVFGDGSQELSVIYAGDLATALVAAAVSPAAANRTYYAAHPAVTTSRELVRSIGRAVGREVRVLPLPGPLARGLLWTIGSIAHATRRATLLSADKAAEFLAPAWTCRADALVHDTGWRARTDLETGLRRTATWYHSEGWL